MDNPDTSNIVKTFNKLYQKQSYFEKYGVDVIIALIIIFIFFVATSYYYVMSHLTPVKKNWNKEKCNPIYIPFAGIILNDPNKSVLDVTSDNFNGCVQNLLVSIVGIAFEPLYYIMSIITEAYNEIGDAINNIRAMFNNIRNSVKNVGEDVMGRTLNITTPVVQQTIEFKSVAGKTQGIFTGALYTMFGAYETLRSFLGSIIEIIITLVLIPLAASIIGLFAAALFTFGATLPEAFGLLAAFTAIVLPLSIIILDLNSLMSIKPESKIPDTPSNNSCFDKETPIRLRNGIVKKISEIENGDILEDNSIVTGVMQMSSEREDMYNLENTIVSGRHKFYNEDDLTSCVDGNYGELIDDYNKNKNPIIYCFNTSNKYIFINNIVYTDYDECSLEEIFYLTNKFNCRISEINKKCDISFNKNTLIKLNDNTYKSINNIVVGDILENNNKVIGKIILNSNNLENIYKIKLNNNTLIYSNKLYLENNELFDISSATKIILDNNENFYNLVTESGYINIVDINVKDYNSSLDMELKE